MVRGSDAELAAELAYLDARLLAYVETSDGSQPAHDELPLVLPGFIALAERHHLSRFDCAVLLLAVAPHVDRRYARLYQRVDGESRPSIGFAIEVLADPFGLPRVQVLARFEHTAPLVAHGLVRVSSDEVFSSRRLEVPDVVWKRMLGMSASGPYPLIPRIDPDQLVLWTNLRRVIADAGQWLAGGRPVIVRGPVGSGRQAIASSIAASIDRRLMDVGPDRASAADVTREEMWHGAVALHHGAAGVAVLSPRQAAMIVVADAREALPAWLTAAAYHVDIDRPDSAARVALWQRNIGTRTAIDLELVVDQFRFGPAQIEAASTLTVLDASARGTPASTRDALTASRRIGVTHLERLAERLEGVLSLDDLVLAPKTRRELELAIGWGRQLARLRSASHAPHLRTAGGLACLFAGPSGTGKTTAASVLARMLDLPAYRIDLSQIVDKYVGETEKNLARVFDDAESSNVVLFFDEADALFARRTEIRDAHDRFANIETGYLLQRIERHPGIAILATNLKANLDDAFARRLQVVVEFGLPDVQERGELWRRMLPAPELRASVDIDFLATRFPLSGGDIRNAVVTSMVLANADSLAMEHVMVAVWRELQRSGRLADGADFTPWQSQLAGWIGRRPRGGS